MTVKKAGSRRLQLVNDVFGGIESDLLVVHEARGIHVEHVMNAAVELACLQAMGDADWNLGRAGVDYYVRMALPDVGWAWQLSLAPRRDNERRRLNLHLGNWCRFLFVVAA